MIPFITLNGVSSLDKGLRLVEASPFILPARTRQRETIPGRLGSISSSDFEIPAKGMRILLAKEGDGKSDIISYMHEIAGWLMSARTLTLWYSPDHYYTGAVEGDADFSMLTKRHGQIEIEFMADPPCRHRALVTGGFIPSPALPIPEQISDTIKTAVATGQSSGFELDALNVKGTFPPALYLKFSGYWGTLNIGGLEIIESSSNTTLYIDSITQEVYKMVGGVRTNVRHMGDFPELTNNKLNVSGTDFNLSTARLLVIERG